MNSVSERSMLSAIHHPAKSTIVPNFFGRICNGNYNRAVVLELLMNSISEDTQSDWVLLKTVMIAKSLSMSEKQVSHAVKGLVSDLGGIVETSVIGLKRENGHTVTPKKHFRINFDVLIERYDIERRGYRD